MMKDTKTARFELRLTAAEKQTLQTAAQAAHRTLADYLRSRMLSGVARPEGDLIAA